MHFFGCLFYSFFLDHFNLMPNAFGRILQEYHVSKLQLSLTQGLWRQRLWGYYSPVVPIGASIYALFENDTARSIDHKWRGLVHSLSGLFCASFSQIDSAHTVSPMYKLHKDGHISSSFEWKNSRYGVLPSETVCTENLTPWKKLLPCKTDRGLVALLRSSKIYGSYYSSLALSAKRTTHANAHGREDFELHQTVTVVLDNDKNDSNMLTLFGSGMKEACAIATSSVVLLKMPRKGDVRLQKIGARTVYRGHHFVALDSAEWAKRTDHTIPAKSVPVDKLPVTILSRVYGIGFHNLTFVHELRNEANVEVAVLFRHIIPWFIRIYFHTLRFSCDGMSKNRMGKVHYQAARDRSLPHYLEVPLLLPSGGNCSLMINFDKSLLRWTEYPSDANYGFRLPAASVEFYLPLETESFHSVLVNFNMTFGTSDSFEPLQIFGEQIVVYMPTPDFSMPYNVLCLVCTVFALSFGPVHNLTTRRFTFSKAKRRSLLTSGKDLVQSWISCLTPSKRNESQIGTATEDNRCG
ncbi:GPI transamidase component PIG T [Trichuris trichiura]|uniref:GPI transamidase component PIG T n=1 Tax=Trichuris trichiura TaxID=36087 RepID=A0A077ZB30_TRITR|nr:GPI transamidase component PIG T [Trichuris trichiura]